MASSGSVARRRRRPPWSYRAGGATLPKLRHSAAQQAARWGRLSCWLSSGAENLINWVMALPRWQTEGHGHASQNDSGDRGVLASVGLALPRPSTQKYQRTQTTGATRCAQAAVRTTEPASQRSSDMRHCGRCQTRKAKTQRDAEATVEQAAVSCAQLWLVSGSSTTRWRWTTRSVTKVPRDVMVRQS